MPVGFAKNKKPNEAPLIEDNKYLFFFEKYHWLKNKKFMHMNANCDKSIR